MTTTILERVKGGMFVYTVGYVDGVKKQAWLVVDGNTKIWKKEYYTDIWMAIYLQCIEIALFLKKSEMRKRGIQHAWYRLLNRWLNCQPYIKPVDALDESKQNTDKEGYKLCALCHTMPGTGFHSDMVVPDF